MAKIQYIGLDELELTNNDLFVRKNLTELDKNAQVLVEETHNAILIKDGQLINTLPAGRYDIFDKHDKHVLKVEVVYMSKTAKLKALWGTRNKMNMRDPITETRVEVGVNGEYEVQIKDPRKFYLELVGVDKSFTLDRLKERLLGRILDCIEPNVAKFMRELNLSYIDFAEHRIEIAKRIMPDIKEMFERDYGLNLFSFSISNVYIPNEYINEIEKIIKTNKMKKEMKEEIKENLSEMERIADKNFDKAIIMKQYETRPEPKKEEKGAEPNKTFCPKCGNETKPGDAFCPKCGNKLQKPTVYCPGCGKANAGENAFCSGCGRKLD